jgi:hypothetical protein
MLRPTRFTEPWASPWDGLPASLSCAKTEPAFGGYDITLTSSRRPAELGPTRPTPRGFAAPFTEQEPVRRRLGNRRVVAMTG